MTSTIASSSSANPSSTRPIPRSVRPSWCRAAAIRSGRPRRVPTPVASRAIAPARSHSPALRCCSATGRSRYPSSAVSRSLLVEQPLTPREPSPRGAALAASGSGGSRSRTRSGRRSGRRPHPGTRGERDPARARTPPASDQERRVRRAARGPARAGRSRHRPGTGARGRPATRGGRTLGGLDPGMSAACHQHRPKRPDVKRRRQFNPETPPAVAGTRTPHTPPGTTRSTG